MLPHLKTGNTVSVLNHSLRRVKRIWDRYFYFFERDCGEEVLTPEGSSQWGLHPPPPSCRSRVVNTSFYGTRLPSVSSGDNSANPATSCASRRNGLWRAQISGSPWKRSGPGMLAPSKKGFRVVSLDSSCQFAITGRLSDCTTTYKSRNQSREAGTSSIVFDSVETSAKYISLGSADYRKRLSNTVRISPTQVHRGIVHRGGPPAGSDNGTRSESSVSERGHRICTSLQQGNRGLQLVFHSSKEGWGGCIPL